MLGHLKEIKSFKESVDDRGRKVLAEKCSTESLHRLRLSSLSLNDINVEDFHFDENSSNPPTPEIPPLTQKGRTPLKNCRRLSISCENILESSKGFDNSQTNTKLFNSCQELRNDFESVENLKSSFSFKETVVLSKRFVLSNSSDCFNMKCSFGKNCLGRERFIFQIAIT